MLTASQRHRAAGLPAARRLADRALWLAHRAAARRASLRRWPALAGAGCSCATGPRTSACRPTARPRWHRRDAAAGRQPGCARRSPRCARRRAAASSGSCSRTFFVCGLSTNGLIQTHFISLCGDFGMARGRGGVGAGDDGRLRLRRHHPARAGCPTATTTASCCSGTTACAACRCCSCRSATSRSTACRSSRCSTAWTGSPPCRRR